MMRMVPVTLGNGVTALGVEVKLPKTTLLAISTDIGYIMCGALDVGLLNDRLRDRRIVAARAVGVRTLEELLEAPLESVTATAETLGITVGMKGSDALQVMSAASVAED
ncbi:YunC family protein [Paenibacillus sp. NPDC058071]|uniref:YunC family protein n=1 Tax=Paenibacillus sp. NPDC058071 TaxID=3346326 RepID=UPI0036DADCC5